MVALCRIEAEEPGTGLHPEVAGLHEIVEHLRGRESIGIGRLQRSVGGAVDVQPGHVCDGERAEQCETETEGGAHQVVDVLRRGHTFREHAGGLAEEGVLQPIDHESGGVLDGHRNLASPGEQRLGRGERRRIGPRVDDHLHAGDEGRGVHEVDA